MFPVAILPMALSNFHKWSFLGEGGHDASGVILSAVLFSVGARLMLADLRRPGRTAGAARLDRMPGASLR